MRPLAITALALGLATAAAACTSSEALSGTLGGDTSLAPTTAEPSSSASSTTATAAIEPTTTEAPTTLEPTTTESTTTTTTIDPVKLANLEAEVLDLFATRARKLVGPAAAGVGVALSYGDKVVGAVTFGTDAEGNPLTTTSKFRLASLSKTITAMTVMALVEQRAFDLDDTIGELWKGDLDVADPRARRITVRQLLQHTSGMSDMREVFFKHEVEDWREAAKVALNTRLKNPPGGGYKYSNANYVVLGVLIEQYTGKTADAAAKELVLAPLGIYDAGFGTTAVTDPTGPAYTVSSTRNFMESLGPAGGWIMSPSNVAKAFGALQLRNERSPFDFATRNRMRIAWAPKGQRANARYAIGLERFGSLWGHTGTLQGVRNISFMLRNGYTVTVLTASNIGPRGVELLEVFDSEIEAAQGLPRH